MDKAASHADDFVAEAAAAWVLQDVDQGTAVADPYCCQSYWCSLALADKTTAGAEGFGFGECTPAKATSASWLARPSLLVSRYCD